MTQTDEIIKFLAEEINAERRLSKLEVGQENQQKLIEAITAELRNDVGVLHTRISSGFNRITWSVIGGFGSLFLLLLAYFLKQV